MHRRAWMRWSAMMFPEVAPEWYRKLVRGENSADVHQQTAPEGSLYLLGHVSLAVPDQEVAKLYWTAGIGMVDRARSEEVQVDCGLSQVHCPLKEGAPQQWPGELRFWVQDIRKNTDNFNMLGRTLDTKLVKELVPSTSGGEYALEMNCPFHTNTFQLSEAPYGFAEKLQKLLPYTKSNVLCLSDALVLLPTRELVSGAGLFYEKILAAKVTRKYAIYERQAQVESCQVHFGAGEGLHQTITFKCDKTCPPLSNLGSLCIYLNDHQSFHLAFARCKKAGLIGSQTWEDTEKAYEFHAAAVVNPDSLASIMPMQHIIRYSSHPECPVPVHSLKAARGGA